MKAALSQWLTRAWQRNSALMRLLQPLALLYGWFSSWRRRRYLAKPALRYRSSATIIVVGNINVGGTGKTPVVLALAQTLQRHGVKLAIVSRGHGGHSSHYPLEVTQDTNPDECGDEALIFAARAGCPVVVDPVRVRGVKYLEEKYKPLLILSDDGLQHYALERDLELAVIDGQRGLGNGHLLPCGPLREPPSRLDEVDMVLVNGELPAGLPDIKTPLFRFRLQPGLLHNLATGETLDPASFRTRHPGKIHALAGIGNPERFFSTLTAGGFAIITHVFPDHHPFTARDLELPGSEPVVMTEKDAVKCRRIAGDRHWYLPVDAIPQEGMLPMLLDLLASKHQARLGPMQVPNQ
jgi:tetraacyldisaccharide 4'-kinase